MPARPNAAAHLTPHQFKPGQPGGPGRPLGSRAKLSELAATLLHADFSIHGADVIERVRKRKPEVYLASVVSLLPKRTEKIESPFLDLSDDELEQLEQLLASLRAKTVTQIEATAGDPTDPSRAEQNKDQLSFLTEPPTLAEQVDQLLAEAKAGENSDGGDDRNAGMLSEAS